MDSTRVKYSSIVTSSDTPRKAKSFTHTTDFVREKTFAVTKRYTRKPDDLDSMVASLAIVEDLQMSSTNIITCVETTREALAICYNLEQDCFLGAFTDGGIRQFNAHNLHTDFTLHDVNVFNNGPCTCIRMKPITKQNPDRHMLTAAYSSGFVKGWDLQHKKVLFTIDEKRQVYNLTFHPRLPKFLTSGEDGKINLYDLESKHQERVFKSSITPGVLDGHGMRVFCSVFNPASNYEFVTGGWDDSVQFWDIRQPNSVRHILGVHMCGDGITINEAGTLIVTAAWQLEDPLSLWDYGSGELIKHLEPDIHVSKGYCAKWISPDYITTGGSNSNILRLIHTRSHSSTALINNLPGGVYDIAIGPVRKSKKSHLSEIPILLFCAGKRIYQISFSVGG